MMFHGSLLFTQLNKRYSTAQEQQPSWICMCAVCLLYVNNLPSTMYADDTAITLGNNSAQLFIKPSNTAPTALAHNINKTVSIILITKT